MRIAIASALAPLLGLMIAGCGARPAEPAAPALVGAWRSNVQFQSGAFAPIHDLEFLYVFNAGGTMTESSNYDGAPPVPPAYGMWREVGPGRFEARYEFYVTKPPASFDELKQGGGWLPAGRGVLTEEIQLSADGKSFTSAIKYEAFDTGGKPVEGGGSATGRGAKSAF